MLENVIDIVDGIRTRLTSSKSLVADNHNSLSLHDCVTLAEQNITYNGPIRALALKNSVSDALKVFECLVARQSFLVLNGNLDLASSPENLTTFCREIVANGNKIVNPYFSGVSDCLEDGESYLVLKTSGTTNAPKFILHDQKRVLVNSQRSAHRLGLDGNDRVLIPVSIHHSYGLVTAFIPSLIAGCSIRLVSNTNILNIIEAIRSFKPTVLFATPGLIEMLLKARITLNIPKITVTAGDRIREEIFLKYDEQIGTLLNLYGSTEMGAMATSDKERDRHHRANGGVVALPGIDFKIKNDGDGPGTILCRHDSGYTRYLDHTGKNVFEPAEEYFDTKDIGVNSAGEIKVLGRSDHKINRNGILISFFEIENAIESACSELRKVVVVRTKGQDIVGTQFAAICELNEHESVDVDFIKKTCRAKLGKNMQPDNVEIVDALPVLPNGKVDRKALQSRYC